MKEQLLIGLKNGKIRLGEIKEKHFVLWPRYNEIKDGYRDIMATDKYMYLKDFPSYRKAEEEYNKKHLNFLKAGASIEFLIEQIKFKEQQISLMLIVNEQSMKEVTAANFGVEEVEESIDKLETLYEMLDKIEKQERVIFHKVTQTE